MGGGAGCHAGCGCGGGGATAAGVAGPLGASVWERVWRRTSGTREPSLGITMSKLPPHCTMNDMACAIETGGGDQIGGRATGIRASAYRQKGVEYGILPAGNLHRLLLHTEGEKHSQGVLDKGRHDEDLGDRLRAAVRERGLVRTIGHPPVYRSSAPVAADARASG